MLSITLVITSFAVLHIVPNEAYCRAFDVKQCVRFSTKLMSTTDDRKVVKTKVEVPYGIESWRGGYKTCKEETVEALSGAFPKDLEGTYFRNSFGKFESGKVQILHPFDADGMVAAVTMKVKYADINRKYEISCF